MKRYLILAAVLVSIAFGATFSKAGACDGVQQLNAGCYAAPLVQQQVVYAQPVAYLAQPQVAYVQQQQVVVQRQRQVVQRQRVVVQRQRVVVRPRVQRQVIVGY